MGRSSQLTVKAMRKKTAKETVGNSTPARYPVRCRAASSGATMLIITPVPCSNPARLVRRGTMCTCQWNGPVVVVRRGVEHEVVGGVADLRAQERQRVADGSAHGHDVGR